MAVICSLGAVFIALILLVKQAVILPEAEKLEQDGVLRDSHRVRGELDRVTDAICLTLTDYAHWDDAYQYAGGGYPEFPDDQILTSSFQRMGIDFFAIYDAQGRQIVQDLGGDLQAQRAMSEAFARDAPFGIPQLSAFERLDSVNSGLLNTSQGPLVVCVAQVLHNDRSGPAAGLMLMARHMSGLRWEELGRLAQTQVRSFAPGEELPAELSAFADRQGGSEHYVLPAGVDSTAVIELTALDGSPSTLLEVQRPRYVTRAVNRMVALTNGLTVLIGLLMLLATLLLLERGIIGPIRRLSGSASQIAARPLDSARLPERGADEVAALSASINRMLEGIVNADRELFEKTRKAELEAIHRTAATYAHEINSPLAGVMAYIQILQEMQHGDGDVAGILREMYDAAGKMRTTIGKLEKLDEAHSRDHAGHTHLLRLDDATFDAALAAELDKQNGTSAPG